MTYSYQIDITPAADERAIDGYAIYWALSEQKLTSGDEVVAAPAALVEKSSNLSVQLAPQNLIVEPTHIHIHSFCYQLPTARTAGTAQRAIIASDFYYTHALTEAGSAAVSELSAAAVVQVQRRQHPDNDNPITLSVSLSWAATTDAADLVYNVQFNNRAMTLVDESVHNDTLTNRFQLDLSELDALAGREIFVGTNSAAVALTLTPQPLIVPVPPQLGFTPDEGDEDAVFNRGIISGNVTILPQLSITEQPVSNYILSWGDQFSQPLVGVTALASLSAQLQNLHYFLPRATAIPPGAACFVVTAELEGEPLPFSASLAIQDTYVSSTLVSNVQYINEHSALTFTLPDDFEADAEYFLLYASKDGSSKNGKSVDAASLGQAEIKTDDTHTWGEFSIAALPDEARENFFLIKRMRAGIEAPTGVAIVSRPPPAPAAMTLIITAADTQNVFIRAFIQPPLAYVTVSEYLIYHGPQDGEATLITRITQDSTGTGIFTDVVMKRADLAETRFHVYAKNSLGLSQETVQVAVDTTVLGLW